MIPRDESRYSPDGESNVPVELGSFSHNVDSLSGTQGQNAQDLANALPNLGSERLSHISNPASVEQLPTDIHDVDNNAVDDSFGVLVLGEGGRSKYLGPTAGSEWLKDVSR